VVAKLQKKKKKKKLPENVSKPPTSTAEDEELARKLQTQLNAEAEYASIKSETMRVSDEEYAQRLQSMYLKTDPGNNRKQPAKKKDEEKKPDEEKSLWSRLWGNAKQDESDEEEESGKPTDRKRPTTGDVTLNPPGTGRMQPMPLGYPYPTPTYVIPQQGGMPYYTSYIPLAPGMMPPTGPSTQQ